MYQFSASGGDGGQPGGGEEYPEPGGGNELSAAGGDGGQPRGGEEYPEPAGGQPNRLRSHVTFPLTVINCQLLEVMVDNQEVEKNILSLVVDSLLGCNLMSLSL